MSSKQLRFIRLTSLLLICLLGGFYASQYVSMQNARTPDPGPGSALQADITGEVVHKLPDFSLSDLNGEDRSIAEWTGRPLVINFWATWCAPCRREMPLLEALHQERGDQPIEVIGIAIDRLEPVVTFVAESGVTYPILAGQQDAMNVAESFGPEFIALPFTVFTAPGGEILLLHSGELHAGQLRRILKISDQVAAGTMAASEGRALLAAGPDPESS